MSRTDRRRSEKNKGWSSRENTEQKERNERSDRNEKFEKNGKRHESRGRASYERRQERRRALGHTNSEEIRENENAIRVFKENVAPCEICGKPIEDITSSIKNKGSGNPVHFDCVLNKIAESEKLSSTEKIAYIGQGKFAVIYFENPHDPKKFSIRRTIEWENREDKRGEWRDEIAGLYSQVK